MYACLVLAVLLAMQLVAKRLRPADENIDLKRGAPKPEHAIPSTDDSS
jgi:hypothetical protein